jgi:hypothetical protein
MDQIWKDIWQRMIRDNLDRLMSTWPNEKQDLVPLRRKPK